MKLKSQKKSKSIIIIVAILALVLIAAVIFGAIYINKMIEEQKQDEENQVVRKIAISIVPKTEYYVGDELDLTGLKIQVIAGTNEYSYFVSYPNSDLVVTGFDSSVANDELPITVSYQGFTATFNVKIKEHASATPVLERIEISDNFQTTYDLEEWNNYGPNTDNVTLTLVYSDGSVDNVQFKHKHIYGFTNLSAAGTTQITIKYSDGVTTVELPVTITITE